MNQSFQYSQGEKTVQKSAGVTHQAARLTAMVKNFVAPHGQAFIQNQLFFIISSVDKTGALWTSIVYGKNKKFLNFVSDDKIKINFDDINYNEDDILYQNLTYNPNVGILFIEFNNRRRFRLNGQARIANNTLEIIVDQAFPNCPKYIQARTPNMQPVNFTNPKSSELKLADVKTIIEKSDTFIMGTQGKNGGVDCSHRGGMKGFLKFINENTILIPDYSGNNMFTSLGNIFENPNTGLLFIGFETGATLQLSGKAKVELDKNDLKQGIERYWSFTIEKNIFTPQLLPAPWSAPLYSPLNPAIN